MPTTFKNQYWTRIQLDMKLRSDATTKTVYFLNQPLKNQWLENYFPILLDVSEVGATAGDPLPQLSGGSFTINDTIGSYGFQRKFSDILQRYEATDCKVTLAFAKSIVSDTTPTLSFTDEWVAYVDTIDGAPTNTDQTLTFNLKSQPFPDRRIAKVITADEFPTAPDESIGKSLPLIFGSSNVAETIPLRLGELTANWDCLGYATEMPGVWTYPDLNLGNVNGTDNSIYIADEDGDYNPVYGYPTTLIFATHYTGAPTGQIAFSAQLELLQVIEPTGSYTKSTSWICKGAGVSFAANGSGVRTSGMAVTVTLWQIAVDDSLSAVDPIKALTSAEITMSDYDTSNNVGSGHFEAEVNWPVAQVLNYQKWTYALGFSATGFAAGDAGLERNNSSTTEWTRSSSAADSGGFKYKKNIGTVYSVEKYLFQYPMFDFSASTYTTTDSYGLRFRFFVVEHPPAPLTIIDTSQLDFILRLKRSASVEAPQTLLSYLSYTYSGSWSDASKWDTSTLSSQYSAVFASSGRYARSLHGVSQGDASILSFTEEIARNAMCRVGQGNDGKYFLYPWGPTYTAQYTIGQDDISVLSINRGPVETVVNRILANYGYTYQSARFATSVGQATIDNYLYNLDPSDDAITAIIGNSKSVYGLREADVAELPFIYDATTARNFIDYTLITSREPIITAEIVVPHVKYRTLRMFDKINVTHPAFSSYFGASADQLPVVYRGTGAANTGEALGKKGYTYWRGQTYRALILGRYIKAGFDAPPLIRLVIQLITNPDDPT